MGSPICRERQACWGNASQQSGRQKKRIRSEKRDERVRYGKKQRKQMPGRTKGGRDDDGALRGRPSRQRAGAPKRLFESCPGMLVLWGEPASPLGLAAMFPSVKTRVLFGCTPRSHPATESSHREKERESRGKKVRPSPLALDFSDTIKGGVAKGHKRTQKNVMDKRNTYGSLLREEEEKLGVDRTYGKKTLSGKVTCSKKDGQKNMRKLGSESWGGFGLMGEITPKRMGSEAGKKELAFLPTEKS